jgi:hypothetical protein
MAKKHRQRLTPSNRTYVERFLEGVEKERAQAHGDGEIESILAGLESDDECTRAAAVRQICPCRTPVEVFRQLRKAAKHLQRDANPLVRANALHIEEDARKVESIESELERAREQEESAEYPRITRRKRGQKRQRVLP